VKLFMLNSKPFDPNGYIFQALVRALKRQEEVELVILALEDLAQVPYRPDTQALLVYGGEELHRIPASAIQGAFGRRAVWFTEDPYERERNKLQAGMFQSVFSNDSGSVSAYPQARYLPLAADAAFLPESQSGLPAYPPERLAFFSGTAWPNRKHLLAALQQTLEQPEALDLHLVANAVVESMAGQQGLEHPLHFSPPIPISEFCLRARRSLCTLVIGRDFSGSGRHTYARSPGPRLFEAGITGSCQLVYAGEIPEVPDGLEEGSHFLSFRNLLELVSLLREARQAPERFQAIGAAMAAQILAHHTYEQRAEVLVSSLRGCQPETVQLAAPARSSLRVLFISHEQTRPGFHFGGAGLCLDRILAAAPPQSEVRVLCRSGDDGHRFELFDRGGVVVGGFSCKQRVDLLTLHHPEFEAQLETLLADWQPQIVHVNHILGFTPAVFPLARRAGAITLFTPWDYYVLCDSWNLLDARHQFCDLRNFFDSRCLPCTQGRLPQYPDVDPLRRRVVMAEALAHVHHLIMPSVAAEHQLRSVFTHLPASVVIEPVPVPPAQPVSAASGEELVALLPGNLAPNKGYHDLRQILEQVVQFQLPIRFRILGRVDAWIRRELEHFPSVELAGPYAPGALAAKSSGCDLALFLSPWPETYCITFDEWALAGRACFFYAIGALSESHRYRQLHPGSRRFAPRDVDAVVAALIAACTPAGLAQLREDGPPPPSDLSSDFGERHWQFFRTVLEEIEVDQPLPWQRRDGQRWVDASSLQMASISTSGPSLLKARIRHFIFSMPGGHRAARLWRHWRHG
jgi:glycosyltransferase involved in cell wall biosynthesis